MLFRAVFTFAAFAAVGASAQVITASSVNLNPGFVVSGSPANMNASDNDYYILRPGIVLSNSQSPIALRLTYIVPGQTPIALRAVVESRAQQIGEQQTVEAFNFVANSYAQLSQSLIGNDPPDNVFTLSMTPPADFIGPGDEVRLKISYKGVFPFMSYPWQIYIDEATLRYSP